MTNAVAIITGAGGGIGTATALALARDGWRLALAGRRPGSCDDAAAAIRESGDEPLVISCDVTRRKDVDQLVGRALNHFGRIDALINNAGTMDPIGLIEDCNPEAWARTVMTNLVGAFYGCHAVLPVFRKAGTGVIVNLSTGAAFHALEGWSAYCASKAGLAMLTRVLAAEVAGTGIRTYGFQPGMVNTPMTQAALPSGINRVAGLDPRSFPGPDEPAAAIAWLCRERPADLDGEEIDLRDADFRQRVGLAPLKGLSGAA